MKNFTLHELQCFDALMQAGSFQAAAERLHRTHPSVFAAVGKLERQLGIVLFDRSGYRLVPTMAGRALHRRARGLIQEYEQLRSDAAELALGEESDLRVVIGDLCPLPQTLALLRRFFESAPRTQLHLHFEALSGPWERLFDGDADLILHHIDKHDGRFDYVDLFDVRLAPVVAPGFLPFAATRALTPRQMRDLPQCVIRDSARHSPPRDYFVIDGAQRWTVADQLMKKEVILQGMGWGHLPDYLIERELRNGKLISIRGRHLPGSRLRIVAARLGSAAHGPVARRLWTYIAEQAVALQSALGQPATRSRVPTPRHGGAGRK